MKIHLAAEPARPRSAQGGLFLPPSPEPEKLELTLARIAGIVGEHKVGSLELLDTHHPDGFRMRRFVAEVARKTPQKQNPDSAVATAPVTALRRFRPPLRANVTLENGQPVRVAGTKKKKCRVMCSGKPAPGVLPAIGGNEKPGRAMNGIWPSATAMPYLSTALYTICSEADGLWKEPMTDNFHTKGERPLKNPFLFLGLLYASVSLW